MKKKGGYGVVYQDVMRNSSLSPEAKAIYAYLSSIAGLEDSCYPSVETMQKELCMSKNRLMKHMGQLIDSGVVEKLREKSGNIYGRNVYRVTHETEVTNGLKCNFRPLENEAVEARSLQIRPLENEATNNNNINNNNKKNNNKGKPHKSVKTYFPDDETLNQAFIDYAEMRRQIKKPMTDRAVELAIKKLRELAAIPFSSSIDSDLAVRILNQSILYSWQGLFPLKDYQNKNGGDVVGNENQSRGQAADFYEQFLGTGNGN